MSLTKWVKTPSVLVVLTVLSTCLATPALSKDTIQQAGQGPANMDVPKSTPAPTPAPQKEVKPKKEQPGSASSPSSGGY